MKNIRYVVGLLLIITACNKPLLKYNSDFEGTWYSVPVYNTSYSDYVSDQFTFSGKSGRYQVDCRDTCSPDLCNCLTSITGRSEINSQRTLIRLDNSQTPRTFNLDEEPYQDSNGKWFMKVDGKTYVKQ